LYVHGVAVVGIKVWCRSGTYKPYSCRVMELLELFVLQFTETASIWVRETFIELGRKMKNLWSKTPTHLLVTVNSEMSPQIQEQTN